jgi:hypothetical protein
VNTFNKRCFEEKVAQRALHYRCIALHERPGKRLTVDELAECFKYTGVGDYGATYVDIAVGSRVRITHNLATELGKLVEPFINIHRAITAYVLIDNAIAPILNSFF